MAMAQPLKKETTKIVLFAGPLLQSQGGKSTINAFKREGKCNANNWSLRILCKQSRFKEAMHILHVTNQCVDSSAYDYILQGCLNNKAPQEGKLVHAHMIQTGFKCQDICLENKIVTIYAKCGSLVDACRIFDQMPERNVVSWTVMIAAYSRHGCAEQALKLFHQMQKAGIQPDQFTFAGVLRACADLAALKEVHKEIIRSGFQADMFVGNSLVDMYAKCGNIEKARYLFDKMRQRNVVSWTAMMAGYAQNGQGEEALKLFRQMQLAGLKPNSNTFASVLPACANLAAVKDVHEEIISCGLESNVFVGSALVDMYAKCGSIEDARHVFDEMPHRNVVSWNAMLAGYAQSGLVDEALKLFQRMPERNVVSWTSMITAYAYKGRVDEALKLFQKMPKRNVVSWTAMIAGLAQNGHGEKALKLFRAMPLAGVKPNSKTFASVLPACASLAALEQGKEIHEEIIKSGFQSDAAVGSALVDMYAKCGSIDNARSVFDKMHRRDVVSWTTIIEGYAMHGCGKEALKLFQQMQHSGVKPNHVTLVSVLSACCHSGLVDEGRQYFDCMSQYYHITPAMEHYGCIVDLLGRAGRLDEAYDLINEMPIKPDATVWGCLLGACRIHHNVELGKCVAEKLFELDPKNPAPYVLLSNIYAAVGKWDGIEKVRKMMKDRMVKTKPGCSWIEVNKQVYTFLAGDRSHPQTQHLCTVG
eukprot:Gb_33294 [translate_table: standard]